MYGSRQLAFLQQCDGQRSKKRQRNGTRDAVEGGEGAAAAAKNKDLAAAAAVVSVASVASPGDVHSQRIGRSTATAHTPQSITARAGSGTSSAPDGNDVGSEATNIILEPQRTRETSDEPETTTQNAAGGTAVRLPVTSADILNML